MASQFLLSCGIVAPLLFVATDIAAGTRWKGYSFVSQSINELSALGASTRAFAAPMFLAHSLLLTVFSLGVWGQAAQNTALRAAAALLLISGVASFFAAALFPMKVGVRPSPRSATVRLGAIAVISQLAAVAVGIAAFTGWFRFYSIGTVATLGGLTIIGLALRTQGRVGLQERVIAYAMLLWVGALAAMLLTSSI